MTARVVLACDGMEGMFRCRQAIPVGEVLTGSEARYTAKLYGEWSSRSEAGKILDLCPACTKRRHQR
jgi:hypothetical protein